MAGEAVICKWKDNKQAAYSLCADDSSHFHLDFMIPEMKKRGFKGTFWVNPGRETWLSRKDEWFAAAAFGNDFADHTMHHEGAKTYEEADYEIGEAARIIREINPTQTLLLFDRGGATQWSISEEEIEQLLLKHKCVQGRGGGERLSEYHVIDSQYVSATAEEMAGYPDLALREGRWRMCAFHHVGPGAVNLPTDAEPFIALLDALDKNRNRLWIDTNTNIHKYVTEFENAAARVLEVSETQLTLSLTAGLDTWMYNYPLTLQTKVPDGWKQCTVTQDIIMQTVAVSSGVIQYEALPDRGDVLIVAE